MRYFYDCEFLEDGRVIELISIGIVAEDGREYYAVSEHAEAGIVLDPNALGQRIRCHKWLMEHVVPHLPLRAKDPITNYPGSSNPPNYWLDMDSPLIRPVRLIRNEVREFLRDEPELWAYYGAYDHICLMQLFGSMQQKPAHLPMWSNDLQQVIHARGISDAQLPAQDGRAHNALDDARWNRDVWLWLQAREG